MEDFLNEEVGVEETVIFYYKDRNGNKLFTSNEEFASVRASFYGNENYYVYDGK